MSEKTKTVSNQLSWQLANDDVELWVTELGGHMAPVTFHRSSASPVQPYYISPWHDEELDIDEAVLRPLRGDFFCMPFGAGSTHRKVEYPTHGEPATERWSFVDNESADGVSELTLKMETKLMPGVVTKRLRLVDGQNVVYVQHVLDGYSGKTSLGHHATLAMPEKPGAMRVSTSPTQFGMTDPDGKPFFDGGQYYSLPVAKRFSNIKRVPSVWKDPAYDDCSSFPRQPGFTDIIAVFAKQGKSPAWTTAVVSSDRYLWFSLKDPAVLPTTILWMSNRGRHMAPWNGRNACLGLEEVCGHFASGMATSAKKNMLTEEGIPTTVSLSKRRPTAVNYIEGVTKVPAGFDRVKRVTFEKGGVVFTSESGKTTQAEVAHEFVHSGEL
jgi:hypothetical protein